MKTIVYDHTIFLEQKYGGISRYFSEVAARLSQANDWNVKVIAPIYRNEYLKRMRSQLRLGVFVPPIDHTVRIRRTVAREASKVLLNLLQPDVVHETYYLPERLAPKRSRVVVTVHDMIHEKFSQYFGSADFTAQYKASAVARADAVICVSENTRRDVLERYAVDPDRVFVTHLGCPFPTLPTKALSQAAHPYLLYVGPRYEYKNFSRLLQAYATSKALRGNVRLLCFGSFPFTDAEQEQIAAHQFTPEQVQHVSGDDATLISLYSNAAALVYPSLYEGFGIPPLEAMACRCPVICSDRSAIPEVVGDAGEYFNPDDTESMTAALEKVLFSSDRTHQLIQLGVERVKQFTWERCVEKTSRIYTALL